MKDVDAAWLAAAIDGEGTISILRRGNNKKLVPYIALCNNNKEFIDKASALMDIHSFSKNKKTFRIYTQYRDKIKYLILAMAPYLIIKRHNARCVLKMIDDEVSNYEMPELKNDRPNTSINARNYLKGNRGNSDSHRKSALCAKNHYLKGNRGNSEQHSLAGLRKGRNIL